MTFGAVTATLMTGMAVTLKLFFLTLLIALPLGLVVCLGTMSPFAPLRWLVKTVVWIVRGSPLMIQIMVIFYGPGLLFGWRVWGPSPSTRPAILPRSTGAVSSPSPQASRRRASCWA